MLEIEELKDIEGLLQLDEGKKIIGHKVGRLTAPGENYGSLMLSVEVNVETPGGNEQIYAIAKMVPPNEFIQELFNTPVTFRNEIEFYKTIVPLLQNFQKRHGVENVVDFFPKYFGSRLNLNGEDKVDDNAVLVLENLKFANYVNLERTEGFELDVTKLIIADLAHLHAVPVALKMQQPEVFATKILPYMAPWRGNEQSFSSLKTQLASLIDTMDELKPLKERILIGFDKQKVPPKPREPFATICHNDCWVNNTMIKFEGDRPVKNKMVDFQICSYGSPARDILFFLFSSVKNHVLAKHYNELLELYYQIFISVLKRLKCDTVPFTFLNLQKELDFEAENSQFGHVVFMLSPIFANKDEVKDMSEFTAENMLKLEASELHKQKLLFVVNEFVKRNWI